MEIFLQQKIPYNYRKLWLTHLPRLFSSACPVAQGYSILSQACLPLLNRQGWSARVPGCWSEQQSCPSVDQPLLPSPSVTPNQLANSTLCLFTQIVNKVFELCQSHYQDLNNVTGSRSSSSPQASNHQPMLLKVQSVLCPSHL